MAEDDRTHDLLIEREFAMPAEALFELWTDPQHRLQWWGPKNFTCTEYEADLRPGGAWRATIENPDWGTSAMNGVFREIVPGKRLVFTFVWDDGRDRPGVETLVTVTFSPTAGGTRQSFHQAPFMNEEGRDSHVEGWEECFDRQADYAAQAAETAR